MFTSSHYKGPREYFESLSIKFNELKIVIISFFILKVYVIYINKFIQIEIRKKTLIIHSSRLQSSSSKLDYLRTELDILNLNIF